MTSRARAAAVLTTGLLVAALAGCAVPGESTGPGARPSQIAENQAAEGEGHGEGDGESSGETPGPGETATPDASTSASPSSSPERTPIAELASLSGVRTQITLDRAFLETLTGAAVRPVAVGDATLSGSGLLSLPITGGSLRIYAGSGQSGAPLAQGSIAHQGSGLQLTGGNKRVTLRNLVIDPETGRVTGSVAVNGAASGGSTAIFTLDDSGLQEPTRSRDGQVVLRGATISLTTQAAALLNETFGARQVTDSEQVGTVVITAK